MAANSTRGSLSSIDDRNGYGVQIDTMVLVAASRANELAQQRLVPASDDGGLGVPRQPVGFAHSGAGPTGPGSIIGMCPIPVLISI